MTVEFEAAGSGKANIEAQIAAVNEAYALEENLKITKTVEIQG